MVNFLLAQSHLELLRIEWGDEHELIRPTYARLAELLSIVRNGGSVNHCIECSVRLFGEVEGQLYLMRVNDVDDAKFLGWVVQLSSHEDFVSFLLSDSRQTAKSGRDASLHNSVLVEMLGCHECVDQRCILSHATLIRIRQEMFGSSTASPFRWIDFVLALRAL